MALAFPSVTKVELAQGPVGSGLSDWLADRAASLAKAGVQPTDIKVFVASPEAIAPMRRRLDERGLPPQIAVLTPREYELTLLSAPQAQAYTGRRARMLLPHEEAFLLEDMRVTGGKEKRLREMGKFFARQWSELADEPGWLLEGEETIVHEHLKSCLALADAFLEPEIANSTVRYLMQDEAALDRERVPFVLVDDFSLLSRASQLLCCLLATDCLSATFDPFDRERAFESFPYAAGVDELVAANPQASLIDLDERCAGEGLALAVRRLVEAPVTGPTPEASMREGALVSALAPLIVAGREPWHAQGNKADAALDGVEILLFSETDDEVAGVAERVAAAVAAGAEPSDVAIACLRPGSLDAFAEALDARGIPWTAQQDRRPLARDVRDLGTCREARQLTLLALLADPEDPAAWRAMAGFGDSLGRSLAFRALREQAERRGMTLAALLNAGDAVCDEVAEEERASIEQVVEVYRRVSHLVSKEASLRGEKLMEALAHAVGEGPEGQATRWLRGLVGPVAPDDDALSLMARALSRLSTGALPQGDRPGVRLVRSGEAAGIEAPIVVLTGCVDGLLPDRRFFDKTAVTQTDAEELWMQGLRVLYRLAGMARERLVCTAFTRQTPEAAQRTGVKVGRIRAERGQRVCLCDPSAYLKVIDPDGVLANRAGK